jgi:hypothetical protein
MIEICGYGRRKMQGLYTVTGQNRFQRESAGESIRCEAFDEDRHQIRGRRAVYRANLRLNPRHFPRCSIAVDLGTLLS